MATLWRRSIDDRAARRARGVFAADEVALDEHLLAGLGEVGVFLVKAVLHHRQVGDDRPHVGQQFGPLALRGPAGEGPAAQVPRETDARGHDDLRMRAVALHPVGGILQECGKPHDLMLLTIGNTSGAKVQSDRSRESPCPGSIRHASSLRMMLRSTGTSSPPCPASRRAGGPRPRSARRRRRARWLLQLGEPLLRADAAAFTAFGDSRPEAQAARSSSLPGTLPMWRVPLCIARSMLSRSAPKVW